MYDWVQSRIVQSDSRPYNTLQYYMLQECAGFGTMTALKNRGNTKEHNLNGGLCMIHQIAKLSLFSLLATIIVIGCSGQDSSLNQDGSAVLNMTDQYGGYQSDDENPAFGEDAIEENFPETEVADSDLNNFASIDSAESDPDFVVYSFEVIWGQLEYDSASLVPTDWSGELTVDTGCIKVVRKIRFERGQDYFLRPRPNAQTLGWHSITTTHNDGFMVFMYFPENDGFTNYEVSFESGPYSRTFTLGELDSLSVLETVDDSGNQISIEARRLVRLECNEGFLEGRWIRTGRFNNGGIFYGRFVGLDGLSMGHLKGHWGVRQETGEKLFFGKWINHVGRFKGFLKGTWGETEVTGNAHKSEGWFEGEYFDRNSTKLGTLSGNWVSTSRGSTPSSGATDKVHKNARGFFHGMWKQYCN